MSRLASFRRTDGKRLAEALFGQRMNNLVFFVLGIQAHKDTSGLVVQAETKFLDKPIQT